MMHRPLRAAVTALGCKVNYAEMADLAGALAAAGVDVVAEHEPADVRVLNSCTVTLQADATTRQRLARMRRDDPGALIALTGCSVDANPQRWLPAEGTPPGVDAVFANADKERIAGWVLDLARSRGAATALEPGAPGRARAFLKVQDGCDHRCTYCIVWSARGGRSRSLALDEVLRRADAALAAGHEEIVLCGVDLGSWGHEWHQRLEVLVAALLARIGTARLRLSSVNANDVGPALAELAGHPRLCPHWHLPLQSGSDRVLRAMHRGYRSARYRRVVSALRAARPDCELTTDVMVGFPGEDGDDHRATLDLVEECAFLHCHVFRWSPRPGTPATALPERPDDRQARARSREVRRVAALSARRRLDAAVGREHEVVWEAAEGADARGLTGGWHSVTVEGAAVHARPGRLARVLATATSGTVLRATLRPR